MEQNVRDLLEGMEGGEGAINSGGSKVSAGGVPAGPAPNPLAVHPQPLRLPRHPCCRRVLGRNPCRCLPAPVHGNSTAQGGHGHAGQSGARRAGATMHAGGVTGAGPHAGASADETRDASEAAVATRAAEDGHTAAAAAAVRGDIRESGEDRGAEGSAREYSPGGAP